ncbi:MAG: hypothetical protein FWH15_06310 [Betaproteobacteria bacterium]|nr:hypothetical protein [Betaproteobacteria bacterium]
MNLTEEQIRLAQVIAGYEAALAIDRDEPSMKGFLVFYEATLPADKKALLAEYEAVKEAIRIEAIRILTKLNRGELLLVSAAEEEEGEDDD